MVCCVSVTCYSPLHHPSSLIHNKRTATCNKQDVCSYSIYVPTLIEIWFFMNYYYLSPTTIVYMYFSFMAHSKLSVWNESWNNYFFYSFSLLHSLLAVAELPFVYKSCVPHLFCLCSEDIMNVKYFIIATRCVQCLFDLWNLLGRNKAITIFFLSVMNQLNILYM